MLLIMRWNLSVRDDCYYLTLLWDKNLFLFFAKYLSSVGWLRLLFKTAECNYFPLLGSCRQKFTPLSCDISETSTNLSIIRWLLKIHIFLLYKKFLWLEIDLWLWCSGRYKIISPLQDSYWGGYSQPNMGAAHDGMDKGAGVFALGSTAMHLGSTNN